MRSDFFQHMAQGRQKLCPAARSERFKFLHSRVFQQRGRRPWLFRKVSEGAFKERRPHSISSLQRLKEFPECLSSFLPFHAFHTPGTVEQEMHILGDRKSTR